MYCQNCGAKNADVATSCINCGKNMRFASELNSDSSPYAGFGKRITALGIDYLITFVFGISIGILSLFITLPISDLTLDLILVVISAFYFIWFESSSYQGTPGKQIVGIKVTDIEGNRISFARSFLRYFLKAITGFFLIGYLTIIFTEKKQGIYDMAAKTVVVYK
jgi:uncharacterized RDD family membrane protein YckC